MFSTWRGWRDGDQHGANVSANVAHKCAQLQRGQGKERYASKSSLLAITQTLVKLFVSSGRH